MKVNDCLCPKVFLLTLSPTASHAHQPFMSGKTKTLLVEFYFSSPHLSLNCEGCWGTTGDFTTSFLNFSLFPTALWDLANSRPVHFLMLSFHLFFCLPCLLPPSLSLARWFWPDLMNRTHFHTTAICVSLQWSGGLPVVQTSLLVTCSFFAS